MNLRRRGIILANSAASGHRHVSLPTFSIPIPPLPKRTPPEDKLLELHDEITQVSKILSDPNIQQGPEFEKALADSQVSIKPNFLLKVFKRFDSSPKPLFALFNWAQNRPGYEFSVEVFNAVIDLLGKAREFDEAWALIFDRARNGDGSERPDFHTFCIMIRRYTRAGLTSEAIRTFENASDLDFVRDSEWEKNLFEVLLDSLCKEGHVKVASQYCDKHRTKYPSWSPSVRIYNILMNGWFRSRKFKQAEQLWVQMKKEGVKPNVVTYGTVIEGLCRMDRVKTAMVLLNEMKNDEIEPNAIVYNPIIDALGEAGSFKEALGMLERFSVLESGPTISTYNSLVKGFCKAEDLLGACKILQMMIDNKCSPTATTYSYLFKYFAKAGSAEVSLDLYTRLVRSGYKPDRLTYHLLLKMLCKEGKLDDTMRVIKEMRDRGFDLDLATSTMLIHLLCKMQRYDESVSQFEDMFRRGIVPLYLTYQRMSEDLHKQGMSDKALRLRDLMASVPHSTKLPDTYKQFSPTSRERKKAIIQKAEAMSEVLKTCNNSRKLIKRIKTGKLVTK